MNCLHGMVADWCGICNPKEKLPRAVSFSGQRHTYIVPDKLLVDLLLDMGVKVELNCSPDNKTMAHDLASYGITHKIGQKGNGWGTSWQAHFPAEHRDIIQEACPELNIRSDFHIKSRCVIYSKDLCLDILVRQKEGK